MPPQLLLFGMASLSLVPAASTSPRSHSKSDLDDSDNEVSKLFA